MAAPLIISSIEFLNNPAMWKDKFRVQVTFEAHEDLPKDIEWQLIYVGAADETCDQLLDSSVVGPTVKGRHKFVLEADAPDESKIPPENVQDITLLLLKCFYNDKMFCKIGWFVTNEYEDEELQTNKPAKPVVEKLKREIQTDDVRVTHYACCWNDEEPEVPAETIDEDADIAFTCGDPIEDEDDEEDDEDSEEDDAEEAAEVSVDLGNITVNDGTENDQSKDVAMEQDDVKGGDAVMTDAEVLSEKVNA